MAFGRKRLWGLLEGLEAMSQKTDDISAALAAWEKVRPPIPFDVEPMNLLDEHSISEREFRRKQNLKDEYDRVRQWHEVHRLMLTYMIGCDR